MQIELIGGNCLEMISENAAEVHQLEAMRGLFTANGKVLSDAGIYEWGRLRAHFARPHRYYENSRGGPDMDRLSVRLEPKEK